jgi:hypothetical protein
MYQSLFLATGFILGLGYPTAFVWWVWYVRRLFYGTS